jgi:hypothetical protein
MVMHTTQDAPKAMQSRSMRADRPANTWLDWLTPWTLNSRPMRKMNVVVNRDRCWM